MTEPNTLRPRRGVLLGYLASILILSACASTPRVPGEETVRIPVIDRNGRQVAIEATLYRPASNDPVPLVVLNHGTPRGGQAARYAMGRVRMAPQAAVFRDLGMAVLVPTRRGYGTSDGPFVEGLGNCTKDEFLNVADESARDVLAAIDFGRSLPFVQRDRVIIAGISAGGLAAIAAASKQPSGVRAAINFAGGRGSTADRVVCGEPNLVAAMGTFGLTTVIPTIWIYATNDRYFGPTLARSMHEGFVTSGGQAEFVDPGNVQTPNGDGHAYFTAQPQHWTPTVTRFLGKLGLISTPVSL